MRIPVIRSFTDKKTMEPYNRGSIYESDDQDRIKELRNGGYLAAIAEEDTPEQAETVTEQPPVEPQAKPAAPAATAQQADPAVAPQADKTKTAPQ